MLFLFFIDIVIWIIVIRLFMCIRFIVYRKIGWFRLEFRVGVFFFFRKSVLGLFK